MGSAFKASPSARRAFLAPKNIIAIGMAGLCLAIIGTRLDKVDPTAVFDAIISVDPTTWGLAIAATLGSFLAIGQYDALFHRWLQTGVKRTRAVYAGMSAIALSQFLGMGLVTGTLTRWRALPDLSLTDALKLTNYVSFSFMAALGLVASIALAVSPLGGNTGIILFSVIAVIAVVTCILLTFAQPNWLPIHLPPLRLLVHLTGLTVIDVAFAGLALWVFLPDTVEISMTLFLAAFTLALVSGLISGAPGGIGPFELCLLTLLPQAPEAELIAAILAYRLVYYALPACLGALYLMQPGGGHVRMQALARPHPALVRAEAGGLLKMPGHAILATSTQALHVAKAADALVMIGDPASGGSITPEGLHHLQSAAARSFKRPAAYKIGARSAATARRLGWHVVAISEDAVLNPTGFAPTGKPFRQLRRKLSQAQKAGVTVELARLAPLAQMAKVARDWSKRTGGEFGFSMGQFSPDYIATQRTYLAWQDGMLVAFATFHATKDEWVLDLMRSSDTMPDGTMHALVVAALDDAEKMGVPRLSLAAMQRETPHPVMHKIGLYTAAAGLRQFKMAFRPSCEPLYLAAPNRIALVLAAIDIALRIRFPTAPERVGEHDTIAYPECADLPLAIQN